MKAENYNEIIALFKENRKIYLELMEILDAEKNSIINIDTDKLWHFTKAKNEKSKEVETVRHAILEILKDGKIEHGMDNTTFSMTKIMNLVPKIVSRKLEPLKTELITLSEEINNRVSDNHAFIEEYLQTVDDMTSIIMGTYDQSDNSSTYSRRCVSSYLQHNGV